MKWNCSQCFAHHSTIASPSDSEGIVLTDLEWETLDSVIARSEGARSIDDILAEYKLGKRVLICTRCGTIWRNE